MAPRRYWWLLEWHHADMSAQERDMSAQEREEEGQEDGREKEAELEHTPQLYEASSRRHRGINWRCRIDCT